MPIGMQEPVLLFTDTCPYLQGRRAGGRLKRGLRGCKPSGQEKTKARRANYTGVMEAIPALAADKGTGISFCREGDTPGAV